MDAQPASHKEFRPYKHTMSQLGFFARFGGIFGAATILAVYAIAVANHDIDPFKSYVSDASGDPPQSGLFGLCVVIMIVMGFPVMYLHHMRNLAIMEATGLAARRLSSLALASATFSCLGMAVVALNPMSHVRRDGQWVWPVFVPHLTGALLFFVSAFVHMLVQTRLMYALNSRLGVPTGCVPAKTLLSAVASVSVVFMVSYAPMGEDIHVDRAYRDTLYDPIINLRRMTLFETTTVESANQSLFKHYARNYPPSASFSIAAEWVFIFCFLLYFASYAGDLRDCTFILDIYILDRVTMQPLPSQQQSVPADNPIPTDGPIPLSIPTPVQAQQPEIHP